MRRFEISMPDRQLLGAIQEKIDNLNKPKGSLGRLEELAMQLCLVQQTLEPALRHPCHLLLGGDHGIEREGVSATPREVTWQQMLNFTRGGGGVNMFCRQHGFKLRIVDMGVDHDLSSVAGIINRKVAPGTRNFLYEAAMSEAECQQAIDNGAALVDDCHNEGCNIVCIGEMGAANTSPSSIWMSLFSHIPLHDCIGAGSGLDGQGISHKEQILQQAIENYRRKTSDYRLQTTDCRLQTTDCRLQTSSLCCDSIAAPTEKTTDSRQQTMDIIRYFGGFEMVGAIGAMLRAAELRMLVMVDGFIMTACALAACQLHPEAKEYMIFGHCGDESGHRLMLDSLGARPLLSLGLRLGEGTGALCAYPIIDSAVRMVNEMNNFQNAKITKYF